MLEQKYVIALGNFERAAVLAKKHEYINECGLAYEMCAQVAQLSGVKVAEENYILRASSAFQQWGASEKALRIRMRLKNESLSSAMGEMGSGNALGFKKTHTNVQADLDLSALRIALKNISEEKAYTRLIATTIVAASQFAGSQQAALLLKRDGELKIEATLASDMAEPRVMQSIDLEEGSDRLASEVINYVARTMESAVVDDARIPQEQLPGLYKSRYIVMNEIRSIMAIPLVEGGESERQLIGMLYLENRSSPNAFTEGMIEALEIIGLAAAGRLELSRKAVTDGLTHLYNYEYFHEQLKEHLLLARRRNAPLSLILLDIDHFKHFNDTWGHQVGDLVLKQVAASIKRSCRSSDIVARYGGEEMVIILPDAALRDACTVGENIRSAIEAASIDNEGQPLSVTASLGISTARIDMSAEQMIRAADEALYAAKSSGRNRVMADNHSVQNSVIPAR